MATETNNNEIVKKEKGKVANIVSTVVLVICILFAILCAYTAYTASVGSGVPSIFGIRVFSIQSDSMYPTFEQGDLVIDKKVDDISTLQVGDIITFWTYINGQKVLNTHRIQEIYPGENYTQFLTKGDYNLVSDTYLVHQNDIVGKYTTHIKGVGTALDFLQTGKGFLICLVVPVAIFFMYEIVTFFKTLSAYKKEKLRLQIEEEKKKNEEATKAAVAAALAAAGVVAPSKEQQATESAVENTENKEEESKSE